MIDKVKQQIEKIGLLRFLLEVWSYNLKILNSRKLTLPDFICIGAQKAGTTWLYENLKQHPEIMLNETKELHYFDKEYLWKPLSWYSSHFENNIKNISGDITPCYDALHPTMIRYMHKIMPNVKIIFGIRNPIDRALSHAIMELIKNKDVQVDEIQANQFIDHFHTQRSLLYGDYVSNLNKYREYFTNKNIYIYNYDDIARHPKKLLKGIFKFLSVEENINWDLLPYNMIVAPNPKYNLQEICYSELLKIYCPKMDEYKKVFGQIANSWDSRCR